MAAIDVDDDTAEALIAVWNASADLRALIPGGPKRDNLPSPQPPLYCQLIIAKEGSRANERIGTGLYDPNGRWLGAPWFDFRRVTLAVYGQPQDCEKALPLMLAVFNQKLGTPGNTPISLPSGARFMRFWPQGDGRLENGKSQKGAKWIYRAMVEGEIQSVRRDP